MADMPSQVDEDLVAIVVLNRNGRDLLPDCLDALERLRWPHVVTLVVDNASVDGSAAAVRALFPTVQVLELASNHGVAGGRNAGLLAVLARCRPGFVLFIDNDTLLESGSVQAFVTAARRAGDIGIVAGKAYRRPGERILVSAGGMRFNPYLGAAWDVGSGEMDRGQYDQPCDVQACPGFAFFVRTSLFDRIGNFDERLHPYGWEDVEFSLRARAAGFRIVYAPDAVVSHLGGRVGRGPKNDYERHKVTNMLRMLRRHATIVQLACCALLLPPRAAYRIARELSGGNWRVVGAWVAGIVRSGGR